MTNALSKLCDALETWSFRYNCYEAVHPWTPFCTQSALDLGLVVFKEAIKIYTPLYLFTQLSQGKFDYPSFKRTAQSIFRSTSFISVNATLALLFFCSSGLIFGKFYYYYAAYLPALVASSLAVLIEKPHRRTTLAFYVANIASETLFRLYVAKGIIRPVKNGQVYLFTLSIATIMYLAKKNGFEKDALSSALKFVVGPEEAVRTPESVRRASKPRKLLTSNRPTGLLARVKEAWSWLRLVVNAKHELCPHHDSSCVYYATKSALRALLIGSSAQLGLRLVARAPSIINDPRSGLELLRLKPSSVSIGTFLCAFTGIYKAMNCYFRWSFDSSTPFNCFLAACVAGPSMLLHPSPTIALYVLWKGIEVIFNEAVRSSIVKHKEFFIVCLYGMACSQIFYSALMNPRFIKKSYMAFLDRVSNHRLHLINRNLLDVFGTGSSAGYDEYFPDLDPRFMSRAFLGSIWIWMLDLKMKDAYIQ